MTFSSGQQFGVDGARHVERGPGSIAVQPDTHIEVRTALSQLGPDIQLGPHEGAMCALDAAAASEGAQPRGGRGRRGRARSDNRGDLRGRPGHSGDSQGSDINARVPAGADDAAQRQLELGNSTVVLREAVRRTAGCERRAILRGARR